MEGNYKNKTITVNSDEEYYVNYESTNSSIKIREIKNYHVVDDKKIGNEFIDSYYENGQLKRRKQYVDGKPHGLWQHWYSNGKIIYHGHYVDGKHQELWEGGHNNGQSWYHGYYVNGNKHGLWQEWDKFGTLLISEDHH
jgi:antitoxin component YwqK of YwqJK toxin-antitoxin module